MKLLGIDYGESKIGLAIGDSESKVATPFSIIKNFGIAGAIEELKSIIKKESIEKIVIGLPINDDTNKNSSQLTAVNNFLDRFKSQINIGIEGFDERFTTQEAQRLVGSGRDDDIAAMLLLQSYLDSHGTK